MGFYKSYLHPNGSLYENCWKPFQESEGRLNILSFFLCTVGLVYKDGIKKFASANGICWNGGGDGVKAKK